MKLALVFSFIAIVGGALPAVIMTDEYLQQRESDRSYEARMEIGLRTACLIANHMTPRAEPRDCFAS